MLTEKQQAVYRYLQRYIEARGFAPSYDEIRQHFGFQSFQSVQKHLRQLERKGYIRTGRKNQKRAIRLTEHGGTTVVLPMAGLVAAGSPIEPVEQRETADVPEEMLGSGEYFALRVTGNSMIEEGIFDGDTIVVRRQSVAENGQTVVALVDGEATVKKYYRRGQEIELRPANPVMTSIRVRQGDFAIQGVVAGLMRKYR
ncbi:transcriptional repressor LexA [bacterium]|nr:transcriptional repressor LexA [bacterium]